MHRVRGIVLLLSRPLVVGVLLLAAFADARAQAPADWRLGYGILHIRMLGTSSLGGEFTVEAPISLTVFGGALSVASVDAQVLAAVITALAAIAAAVIGAPWFVRRNRQSRSIATPKVPEAWRPAEKPDDDRPGRPTRRDSKAVFLGVLLRGRYRLTGVIGGTSRHSVYKAWDAEAGTRVAVKCPRLGWRAGKTIARLRREAQLGGRVDHPNVCPVIDLSVPRFIPLARWGGWLRSLVVRGALAKVARRNPAFLVMPFLDGELLSEREADIEAIPLDVGVQFLVQVCAGLHHVHEQKIVFRDIKPENVMLLKEDDETERAVLFDFDLATEYGWGDTGKRLSRDGIVMATPAFMSPEQIRQDALDPASDIYQLGILAYEMFTGRVPFPDDIYARLGALPTPPSVYRNELPDRLEKAILKSMAPDPKDRFTTALEFGGALSQSLARGV